MSRFTLVITPDGKALLAASDELTQRDMRFLRLAWDQWRGDPANALILSGTEVVQVKEIEVDPSATGSPASKAEQP